MTKKRAMSSEQASLKKLKGHKVEEEFARAIGGEVNKSSQQDKKDVLDRQHRTYSVKGGTWWQIFLYRKSRLESNTIFQSIGEIASILIDCIDVFPPSRDEYLRSKHNYKIALQAPMQALKEELTNKKLLAAFLSKALFNGGEVNFLAIKARDENFHIFKQQYVVNCLCEQLSVANSMANRAGTYNAQKVLFKYTNQSAKQRNLGEIEIRNDSEKHYKEAKCRFNGHKTFDILSRGTERKASTGSNVYYYK